LASREIYEESFDFAVHSKLWEEMEKTRENWMITNGREARPAVKRIKKQKSKLKD